jgi:type VI secretion system secreted protein VgrG
MTALLLSFECDAIPSAEVSSFVGSEALGRPYRYEINLHMPLADASGFDPEAALFASATLRIHHDAGAVRAQRCGVVASVELLHALTDTALYRVEVVPRLWQLSIDERSRIYTRKSTPDILEATLRAAGLSGRDYTLRLNGRYRPHEHVCQYKESDLDFLHRWMEREGIYYFFEHDGATERLVITDTRDTHTALGSGLVRYFPTGDGASGDVEALDTFTARYVAESQTVEHHDHDPLAPSRRVEGVSSVTRGLTGVFRTWGENLRASPDARRLATLHAEARTSGARRFFGTGRVFDLCAGYKFTVEEHPRADLNAEYLATELDLSGNQATSVAAVANLLGHHGERSFVARVTAIASADSFRNARSTPWPRVRGFEPAVIDGPIDSEYAQLDEHGSYLVKLRFDENSHTPGTASTRIRMMQPHTGEPEGWHLPLRKGTEVLIAFLGGDPDQPVIAGAMPDAEHPSVVVQSNETQNVIHTGGNNRIEMEDTADHQYIDLYSPPQHSALHLGKHHPHGYHGGHDHNFVLTTDGDGLVHTGGNLDITVGGEKHEHVCKLVDEKYDDTQTTTVKGDVTEIYKTNMTVTVKSLCKETYGTHHTEVDKHREEKCLFQTTTVKDACTETHNSQTTTVRTLYILKCASHSLTVDAAATHTYGTLSMTIGTTGLIHDDVSITANTINATLTAPARCTVETQSLTEMLASLFEFDSKWLTISALKTSVNQAAVTMALMKFDSAMLIFSGAGLKVDLAGVKLKNKALDDKAKGQLKNFPIKGFTITLKAAQVEN